MERFSGRPPTPKLGVPTPKKPNKTVSLFSTQTLSSLHRTLKKTRRMSIPPDQPAKSPTPVPDGITSVLKMEEELYHAVPCQQFSDSPRVPASFLNPLYYGGGRQSDSSGDERRDSVSLSTCSSDSSEVNELVTQRVTSTRAIPIKRDFDTDSICFLEKTAPSLTKTERYSENPGSFVFRRQSRTTLEHVYEACDSELANNYEKPGSNKRLDIFQTMSFKSPLYGTSIASSNSVKSDDGSEEAFPNDTYDVPGSLPPAYPPPPLPPLDGELPPTIPPRSVPVPIAEEPPAIPCRTAPPLPTSLFESPPNVPARQQTQRSGCNTPTPVVDESQLLEDLHIYETGPRDEEVETKLVVREEIAGLCHSGSTTPTNALKSKTGLLLLPAKRRASQGSTWFDTVPKSDPRNVDDVATNREDSSSSEWLRSYTFVGNKITPKTNKVTEANNTSIKCSGNVYQIGTNKEVSKKWVTLSNGYLNFYRDNTSNTPETIYPTKNIMGVTVNLSHVMNLDCPIAELWNFKIYFDDGRNLLLGTKVPSERGDWLQSLASHLTPFAVDGADTIPLKGVQVAAHLFVKIGVAGNFQRGYIIVHQRLISLWVVEENTFKRINLQNVSENPTESFRLRCERAKEMGPSFHLELPQQILYFQSDFRSLTNNILSAVKLGFAMPSNARLEDQYLTLDNIPVVIDKCLKFISTHGTTLQGIYRLSGSSTKVKQLLEKFSENVWGVHLNPEEYSAHDVASVLKRYLRTLPECLLTDKLYKLWVETSLLESKDDRINHLEHLLSHLPDVNYQTLRKITGHLCIIAENSDQNLMPIINLAPVFGPTLLYKVSNMDCQNYDETTWASDTISDLITHYAKLFKVEESELEKERKIQLAVQKMKQARTLQKPAGDLLVGIYIYSKDWGTCINVKLTPSSTAREVCEYAINLANVREPLTKIVLMEVVCDGELERLLHYTESVLDVTLSWSTWGSEESKGNYLCIKHNSVFDAISPLISNIQPLSAFGEVLYADSSNKSFKKYSFEFTSAKLKCFKNSKNAQKINEWNIEDIVWYIGSEKKRSTPTKWAITFIPKLDKSSQDPPVKRSRSQPFFGSTMCFQSEDELYKWIAAFLVGKHPKGLLPVVIMPDLLS